MFAFDFRALICCAVIIFGFWLGVDQELLFSGGQEKENQYMMRKEYAQETESSVTFWGIFFGVTSSFFVAANAIYTKKVGIFCNFYSTGPF